MYSNMHSGVPNTLNTREFTCDHVYPVFDNLSANAHVYTFSRILCTSCVKAICVTCKQCAHFLSIPHECTIWWWSCICCQFSLQFFVSNGSLLNNSSKISPTFGASMAIPKLSQGTALAACGAMAMLYVGILYVPQLLLRLPPARTINEHYIRRFVSSAIASGLASWGCFLLLPVSSVFFTWHLQR